ncbi:MAG: hypothetical protein NWP80_01720 [Candidatus Gracilibacteria bacterium]|nr:hypothetical protein [Candidatus Gracilibacteria bacterium]
MSNFEIRKYYEQEIIRQELSSEELQTKLEAFEKSRNEVKEIQICEIEEKTQEQNILKSFGITSLDDWLDKYFINPEEGISILQNIYYALNSESILKIKEDNEIIEITKEQLKEYLQIGYEVFQEKEQKLQDNILRLYLIQEISGMYKGYLQNILNNISYRMFSNKYERYINQIDIIRE